MIVKTLKKYSLIPLLAYIAKPINNFDILFNRNYHQQQNLNNKKPITIHPFNI